MKLPLSELKFSQKDKLADFSINFAVAWLVAAIVSPFFVLPELTLFNTSRILVGVAFGIGFLCFALLTARENYEPTKR